MYFILIFCQKNTKQGRVGENLGYFIKLYPTPPQYPAQAHTWAFKKMELSTFRLAFGIQGPFKEDRCSLNMIILNRIQRGDLPVVVGRQPSSQRCMPRHKLIHKTFTIPSILVKCHTKGGDPICLVYRITFSHYPFILSARRYCHVE